MNQLLDLSEEPKKADHKNKDNRANRDVYAQLARLAHDSFEQRRSYEWKMHFGLWVSIAAVVYAAIKEEIEIFPSHGWAYFVGGFVIVLYLIHLLLVTRGHWQDKKRKHFYMDKAGGKEDAILEKWTWKGAGRLQLAWILAYLLFTIITVCLAIRLLLSVPEQQEPATDTQTRLGEQGEARGN